MDDLPDIAIPGYEILSFLGRGAMGTVYKARQVKMRRDVALKVIHTTISSQKDFVPRFLREARTVARLSHGNIVAGYDVGQVEDLCYLAMEYVEGESCQAKLTRLGRLDEPMVLQIGLQVARALEHAHRHGVVHRDVKPANIMLAPGDIAKLCDFGLARATERGNTLTKEGVCLGTPMYMAPEQGGQLDIRSDIYSFGASLYHLASGVPPFEGPSMMAILMKHVMQPVVSPRHHRPELSEATEAIVLRTLAKRPGDRYADPSLLATDLQRALELVSVQSPAGRHVITRGRRPAPARSPRPPAPPTPATVTEERRGWKRTTKRIAAASVLALALGLAAAAWVSRGPEPQGSTSVTEHSDPASLLLDDIQEFARDWKRHPDRIPEITARLEDLVRTRAFAACPSMEVARQHLRSFRGEVELEATRQLGPLTERCGMLAQSRRYVDATRELDQYLHDFADTEASAPTKARREELRGEATAFAVSMLVTARGLLESGDVAAARSGLEDATQACPSEFLTSVPDFRQQARAILSQVEAEECKASGASAWALIAEQQFAAAREVLSAGIIDYPEASAVGDLRADLEELALIEMTYAAAVEGASRLAESRGNCYLASLDQEAGFEIANGTITLILADGARTPFDTCQLAAEDVLRLAAVKLGQSDRQKHLRAGLVHYTAMRGGRRDMDTIGLAERELTAASLAGDLRATRHLAEIRRVRSGIGLPPEAGNASTVEPQTGRER